MLSSGRMVHMYKCRVWLVRCVPTVVTKGSPGSPWGAALRRDPPGTRRLSKGTCPPAV